MSKTSPIVLILGAGANVGQHVAQAFAAKGYRIALIARRAKTENDTTDQIHIAADLSNPKSVVDVFSKVKTQWGPPSVVVYNAAAASTIGAKDPFSISEEVFTNDLNINTTSVFAAIQQAVSGFAELPDSISKTFIYTGNILNTKVMPALLTLGVGKAATAHLLEAAAALYKDQGFRFYFADERMDDGSPAIKGVSGEAHAKHYLELAESEVQEPWQQTFVKGVGYKKF